MQADSDYSSILSLFPLQTVLFPGNKLPLRIFEPRYVDLIGRCMREQQTFGIVGIKSGQEAGPLPEIYSIGTEVSIIDFDQGDDGLLNIVVQGQNRFTINSTRTRDDNLLTAVVTPMPALAPPDGASDWPHLNNVFGQLSQHPELEDKVSRAETPIQKAYEVLAWLPLANVHKIELLGADDAAAMLSKLEEFLEEMSRSAQ